MEKFVVLILLLIFLVRRKLFKNSLVRLIIFTYLLHTAKSDLRMSIFIAMMFLLITHIINRDEVEEFASSDMCKKNKENLFYLSN